MLNDNYQLIIIIVLPSMRLMIRESVNRCTPLNISSELGADKTTLGVKYIQDLF